MATNLSNTTFKDIYDDDFSDSANYHRILFNGGKALQARELTQSQTIIQKEIERFGSNIFRPGGVVQGGKPTIDNKVEFIKLVNGELPATASNLIGTYYKQQGKSIIVKIIEVLAQDGSDPETIIVEYVNTSGGTAGSSPVRVDASSVLERISTPQDTTTLTDTDYPELTVAGAPATGNSTKAHIDKGSFFIQGHFVFAEAQSIFISKYTKTGTAEIGFKVEEEIITVLDNTTLYDNSGGLVNTASPGADRYRIKLTLADKSTLSGSDNFVYIAKVTNGLLSDEVSLDTSYNEIGKTMALRTKEESGDYVVKPFQLNIKSVDDSDVTYKLSDGIAYVDGFRLELSGKDLVIKKPGNVEVQTNNNELTTASYGNYVLCYGYSALDGPQDSDGSGNLLFNKNLPDINTFAKLNLRDTVNYGGSTIGTCRARAVYRDPLGHLRIYLFDIRMKGPTGVSSFSDVKSFGTSVNDRVNIVLEGNQAVLKGVSNNTLLFPLPKNRPVEDGGIAAIETVVQKRFQISASSANYTGSIGTLPPGTGNALCNGDDWVITGTDSAEVVPNISSVSGSNFTQTGGLLNTHDYNIYAQVKMTTDLAFRAKNLKETTMSKVWPTGADSDSDGYKFLSLDKSDIFKINAIKLNDSNGADITDNFTLDNGQRDNYYGIGRIIPKASVNLGSGVTIHARYQYFDPAQSPAAGPGAATAYFSVESYRNNETALGGIHPGMTYKDIPVYTTQGGGTIELRDVLDFRPIAGKDHVTHLVEDITFDSAGTGVSAPNNKSIIHLLPQPGTSILSNNTYHLPRKDRIIASTKNERGDRNPRGQFKYLKGIASFDPELPPKPDGSLALYDLDLGGNTVNIADISKTVHKNKRFTMADIGKLENKIYDLEELTALSLLELDTNTLTVLDSAGNARTKAGFLADNFFNYSFTDVSSNELRASIDPTLGTLAPLVIPKSTRLLFDSADGANTAQRFGDVVLLPVADSNAAFLKQQLATTTENINPFAVITSIGHIDLSPSTDTWVETQWSADDVQSGGTQQVQAPARVVSGSLGAWRDNWVGQPSAFVETARENWRTGNNLQGSRGFTATRQRSVAVRTSVQTVTTQVGDRLLSVDVIPFMRSIKVYFRVQGLRRHTRHFPYFGNTAIDDYTKSESFKRWSERADDAGNIFTGNTTHPDGSSTLTSDSNGQITGSFIVPSTTNLRFATGPQHFKLLDISGGEDSNAISTANTTFTSTGTLETRQRIFSSVRVETIQDVTEINTSATTLDTWDNEPRDPLAQSFWIDPIDNPSGIFVSNVKIYFATKEDNFGVPVQCQIRNIIGGVPDNRPIPGAVKFVNPINVNVPSNLTSLGDSSDTANTTIAAAPTNFTFDEPIYLQPGQEYAIVLLAESTKYTVHVAETYEFLIGTTAKRVAKQPTLGSLFMSQNGSTWTPEQTKDLMFVIERMDFNTSGVAMLKAANPSQQLLGLNPFETVASDTDIIVHNPGHGLATGDKVFVGGTGLDSVSCVSASDWTGTRTVTGVDHTGWMFQADSAPNTNIRGGGAGIITGQNMLYNVYVPQVQSMIVNNTSLTAKAKLTNANSFADALTPGGSGTLATRTANGGGYSLETGFSDILLNEFNYTDKSKVILSDSNIAHHSISGGKTAMFQVNLATEDTKVSPVIDLQRINMIGFESQIDNAITINTPLGTPVAETNSTDGSMAAKHITNPVVLEESSVGLKILFGANRPPEAAFQVYWRTANADEEIREKAWTLQAEKSSNPPDGDRSVFREYEYLPGGDGGTLPTFTQFQIKIVMISSNQSKVPTIRDLRVLALVT